MGKFESDTTSSTQKYIHYREKLWNVFNDTQPLSSSSDQRLKQQNDVLLFFCNWRDQLFNQYVTKTVRAFHFMNWQTMFDLQVKFSSARPINGAHSATRVTVL